MKLTPFAALGLGFAVLTAPVAAQDAAPSAPATTTAAYSVETRSKR